MDRGLKLGLCKDGETLFLCNAFILHNIVSRDITVRCSHFQYIEYIQCSFGWLQEILALHKVQIGRIFLIANIMGGCFVIVKSEKKHVCEFLPDRDKQ